MKKLVLIAAVALSGAVMAQEAAPTAGLGAYVGVERGVKAGDNKAYIGAAREFGDFGLTIQADVDLNKGNRGKLETLNVDASYAVGKGVSVYMENDINSNWQRTETTVGAKWSF